MASWSLPDVQPDPRPMRRIRASQLEWADIRQEFEFAACVHCGLPHQHLHHIAFRKADSGDDLPVNLAPICNSCHEKFHRRSAGWERVAASIRQYILVNPARRNYAELKLGERLNTRYPPLPNTDEQFLEDFGTIYPPLEPKDIP